MDVVDAALGEKRRQRLAGEVRMAARPGHGAHVGDAGDAVMLEQREKLRGRARRVADGHDHETITSPAYTRRASIEQPGKSCDAA